MILKISLRAKAGVPKILVKQKLRLYSLISLKMCLCCILFLDSVRFAIATFLTQTVFDHCTLGNHKQMSTFNTIMHACHAMSVELSG